MKGKRFYYLTVLCVCVMLGLSLSGLQVKAGGSYEINVSAGSSAKDIQSYLDLNAGGTYQELVLKFAAGTYELDRSLYIYSNTTIKADANAHFIKQKANGAMLEAKLVNDKGGYGNCHDIVIDGGIWDSKPIQGNPEGTESFRFIHCKNVTVKNLTVCNVPEGSHLIVFAGTSDILVDNCTFYGYGVKNSSAQVAKEAIQLDIAHDVTIVPTFQEVAWDDLPCRNVTITNCDFHDYSRAFGSHTAIKGIYHDNVVFRDNRIMSMSDTAVKLFNYTNAVVSGNTIDGCIEGILVYTDMEELTDEAYLTPLQAQECRMAEDYKISIEGNTIRNVKTSESTWGDGIRVIGSSSLPICGVAISGNSISDIARYGIFATAAPFLTVKENTIQNTGEHAVLISKNSTDASVTGNIIRATKKSGIAIYTASDRALVYGNEISEPMEAGIYLYDNVCNCVVGLDTENFNTITEPGTAGVYITGTCSGNSVSNNRIDSPAKTGIWVYKSKKNTIADNTILSPAENGIHVTETSTSTVIRGNSIQKAGKCGIWVSSSQSCKISGNKITSPKEEGINLNTKSKKAVVEKNTVSSSGGHGIWISGSTLCSVTYNTINKYGTAGDKCYGIGLFQSGGTGTSRVGVKNNTITGDAKKTLNDGIRVSNSNYVTLSYNTIKNAGGCGAYVYMSRCSNLSYNKITTPAQKGIYVTTACDKATISKNTVTKPKDAAIMTYQAANSKVNSNTVTVAGDVTGIRISASDGTTVSYNKVSGAAANNAIRITGSENCVNRKNGAN